MKWLINKINQNINSLHVFHPTLSADPSWQPVENYRLSKNIIGNTYDSIHYKYSIVDLSNITQGTAIIYTVTDHPLLDIEDADTKIYRIENYKDGKLDGLSMEFYSNKKIKEIKSYSGGVQSGIEYGYHVNGSLWIISTIENGERDGLQYNYDLGNRLIQITRWNKGKVVGHWKPK
jgi:antitoxin component YwqK of YwqJK toxin-antitoxin module